MFPEGKGNRLCWAHWSARPSPLLTQTFSLWLLLKIKFPFEIPKLLVSPSQWLHILNTANNLDWNVKISRKLDFLRSVSQIMSNNKSSNNLNIMYGVYNCRRRLNISVSWGSEKNINVRAHHVLSGFEMIFGFWVTVSQWYINFYY